MLKKDIKAGWIVTCVGSLTDVTLRYANCSAHELHGHFEIVSLVGTLSQRGDSHLHLCMSDSKGKCIGGHLLRGSKVFTTAEIVIGESKDLEFIRAADGATEWEELRILSRKQ